MIFRRRSILFFISIFSGLGLLYLVFRFFDWRESLEILRVFSPAKFLFFLLASVFSHSLHALRHRLILKFYHQSIGFYKILGVRLAGFSLSYLIPSATLAGEPLRGHLLSRAGVDSRISYASVILDKFWELAANFILMASFLFLGFIGRKTSWGIILSVSAGAFFYLAVFYLFYSRIVRGKGLFSVLFRIFRIGRLFRRFNNFEEKILETEKEVSSFFRKKRSEFFGVLFLSPLIYFSWLAEIWLLAYFLGVNLGFFEVVLVQFVLGLATLMPVSGGLGFLEAGAAAAFALLGFQGAGGLTFSILQRIKDLILAAVGLLFSLYLGIKNRRRVAPPV